MDLSSASESDRVAAAATHDTFAQILVPRGYRPAGSRLTYPGWPGYVKVVESRSAPKLVCFVNDARGRKVLGPLDAVELYRAVYGTGTDEAVAAVQLMEDLGGISPEGLAQVWRSTQPAVLTAAEAMSAAGLPVDPACLGALPESMLRSLRADGRLGIEWLPGSAVSGRWGARPDILNMPSALRRAIRAPPGRMLVEADLRAAGLVATAMLCGDAWLKWCAAGEDPYLRLAGVLLDRSVESVTPEEREVFKHFGTLAIADAGPEKLAEALEDLPLAVSQEARVRWQRYFPEFRRWVRGLTEKVEHGESITLPYEDREIKPISVGQAIGCLNQALVATCVDHAIVEAQTGLPLGGAVIAMVWDSVIVECATAHVEIVGEILRRALGPSFCARVTVSERWGKVA